MSLHRESLVLAFDGASVRLQNIRLVRAAMIACTMCVGFDDQSDARIPAREFRFSRADIQGMTDYLRSHIGANAPHDIEPSQTFVTDDVDLQLTALSGEAESWEHGGFTLRWMLYCGSPDRSRRPYWLGIEGWVVVADVLRWCADLESLLAT